MGDSFRTIGIYLPSDVIDVIGSFLYETRGLVNMKEYYDETTSQVPSGDPFAEEFSSVFGSIVSDFSDLYDTAEFYSAKESQVSELELVTVAADVDFVYRFREKVEAARVIQGCDTQTIHLAIFRAAVDEGYFLVI